MTPAPGTIPAAVLALAAALVDALTLAGVFHLTPELKTAVMTVLTSLLALASLLVPVFQHNHAVARLRSADPSKR